MFIEDFLHLMHIGSRTDKRVSDKINVLLNGKKYVLPVLLRKRRKVDMLTRNVHALMRTKHSLVLNTCHKHGTGILNDLHIYRSVIEQEVISHLHITCYVRV